MLAISIPVSASRKLLILWQDNFLCVGGFHIQHHHLLLWMWWLEPQLHLFSICAWVFIMLWVFTFRSRNRSCRVDMIYVMVQAVEIGALQFEESPTLAAYQYQFSGGVDVIIRIIWLKKKIRVPASHYIKSYTLTHNKNHLLSLNIIKFFSLIKKRKVSL